MTYEEAIEKVHAIMKYCIDVGMNVDVILELNRVIIEALEKQEQKCGNCTYHDFNKADDYWCAKRHFFTDADMHCTNWSVEE